MAAELMSCSLFWVMLPTACSLLTWSSRWGISALAAVRTRGVATCQAKPSLITIGTTAVASAKGPVEVGGVGALLGSGLWL